MKRLFLLLACLALLVMVASPALAKYPTKEITLVCPWAAGGGTDTVARSLVKNAKKYLGVTVNVVNKTGGGGVVGQTAVAQARPDGYTCGLLADPNHSYMLQGKTKYGFYQGLDPVCMVNWSNTAASVRASDTRFKDFKEFMEFAKKNPGLLTCAVSGVGGPWHLTMASFGVKHNVQFTFVPFGGAAPSRTAMIGGHVDFTVTGIDEMLPFYQSKQANVIVYFAPKRADGFPDVPTATEMGYPHVGGTFRLICLPEGVPAEVKAAMLAGFKKCFNDPEFMALMQKLGLVPYWKEGDDLKKVLNESFEDLKIGLKAVGLIQ